jgi:ABC-type antimicrobial peptide transport system permease subunit
MFSIFQAQRLGFRKVTFYKGKSAFVIIPIAILFAVLVFAASEAKNLTKLAHDAIFSPIQGQNEILELTKSDNLRISDLLNNQNSSSTYTSTDVANVQSIAGVEKANPVTAVPIDLIRTSDLVASTSITIDNLSGIDSTYAKLYTNETFTYTDGQPIPIILNANDFVEVYEDWGVKTKIEISLKDLTSNSADTQIPIKARSVKYSRNELIGKTFTVQFGGLTDIQTFTQETTTSGVTYAKKTAKTIDSEIAARKKAITKYWNYEKISTPITYTFVVAGISEGTDKTTAYVPVEFAEKISKEYLQNAIAARNKTAIPSADYNLTYTGLVYDGVSLQTDTTSTLFAGIRNSVSDQVKSQFNNINKQIATQNSRIASTNRQIDGANKLTEFQGPPGGGTISRRVNISKIGTIGTLDSNSVSIKFPTEATSYAIPGLVYNKNRTTSAITGEYKSFDFTKPLPLATSTMLIKLNTIDSREQVVAALNEKGYEYRDYSKYKQYAVLEKYIYLVLAIASGVFVVVTGLFVLINMAKFVSEGRKEIGIFRAIGATKGTIMTLFLQQAISYIVISLAIGGVLGLALVYGLAGIVATSAQQFISSTLGSTVILADTISQTDFLGTDPARLGLYAGGLLLITLVVALIPASQAARISPVEAIRNN